MTTLNTQANGPAITIRLGNQDFSLKREIRNVKDLKLDAKNQRISFKLRQKGLVATDNELHKLLWEMDSVKGLYQSIYQNGGLIEDPIVNSKNLVIEGNCRTVALRELNKKFPDDQRFSRLYVRVLPEGVTEEQLTLLLGELHIAGKIQWKAYEQAEYVWKMNKIYGKTYDFLAGHLRWSRSKLSQKIAAYEETKAYLERTGDPNGINRFSHFEEFMRKKALRDRRDEDPNFMLQFGDWIIKNKLPESKDVRHLPEILNNQEAYQKFLTKSIKESIAVLYQADPSLVSNLYSTIDQTIAELKTISLQEIQTLKSGDQVRLDKLRKLKNALNDLEEFSGVNFD